MWVRTDEPEVRFAPGAVVRATAGESLTVAESGVVGQSFVVRFASVTDRSAAERLRGVDLWVTLATDDGPERADVFHDTSLIGLEARDERGSRLGRVVRVEHLPAQDVLVIDVDGRERLVPFVRELVPEVDQTAGFVTIAALPGLLDDGGC